MALLLALSLGLSWAASPVLPAPQPRWRGFRAPVLRRGPPPLGAPIAEIRLRPLLDRNHRLAAARLGSGCGPWQVGLGYDSSFRERFLLLSCGDRLLARRFEPDDSLLRGIWIEPEKGEPYRLRFHPRVPDLLGDSFLSLEAEGGKPGAAARLSLLELVNRAVEAGAAFDAGGRELVVFYMSDVDAARHKAAATRTILVVERRGLLSKAWPIPESSLPAGLAVQAKLGSRRLTFVRTADGTLFVYRPAGR